MSYFSGYFFPSSFGPSCIVEGQAIETPSGWEGISNLLRRFKAGQRVEVLITDHITGEQSSSPLIFGLQTMAKATRLILEDGRVVDLTDGHAVPSTPNTGDEPLAAWGGILPTRRVNLPECAERAYARDFRFAKEEYLQEIFRIPYGRIISHGEPEEAYRRAQPEWVDRWAPLAIGDEVDGSPIRSIERIGNQLAARIAPVDLGWVLVRNPAGSAPVRVGTRLHEYPGSWVQNGAVFTNPLNWGAIHDVYAASRERDNVPSWEFDAQRRRYCITNGPTAWALEENETEIAYAHGYLAARAARAARGIRIPEDKTDTLRLVYPSSNWVPQDDVDMDLDMDADVEMDVDVDVDVDWAL